jgi:hypothetical protein
MPNHPLAPTVAAPTHAFQAYARRELGVELYAFFTTFQRRGSQPLRIAPTPEGRVISNAIYRLCSRDWMRVQITGEYIAILWLKSSAEDQPPEVSHEI